MEKQGITGDPHLQQNFRADRENTPTTGSSSRVQVERRPPPGMHAPDTDQGHIKHETQLSGMDTLHLFAQSGTNTPEGVAAREQLRAAGLWNQQEELTPASVKDYVVQTPESAPAPQPHVLELGESFRGLGLAEQINNGAYILNIVLDTNLSLLDTNKRADMAGNIAFSGIVPNLAGMPQQLREAINNNVRRNMRDLINNGVDAARSQGESSAKITISGRIDDQGRLDIQVRDHGPGFPDKIIDRYGDPINRMLQRHVPVSEKTKDPTMQGGQGLGLGQIHEHITKGMQGEMKLGNAPDGGAVIDLLIPIDTKYVNPVLVSTASAENPRPHTEKS